MRGQTLGRVKGGTFRPYAPGYSGPCGDLGTLKGFNDQVYFAEADRTVVYGRARAGYTTAVLTIEGERHEARIGHNGAYLFLFEGDLSSAGSKLTLR